jgi:hypothetical protein
VSGSPEGREQVQNGFRHEPSEQLRIERPGSPVAGCQFRPRNR